MLKLDAEQKKNLKYILVAFASICAWEILLGFLGVDEDMCTKYDSAKVEHVKGQ